MAKKLMSWKTKGMNRDLSVSAFSPEFAFENMNLRLSTNEKNTLMSWVTEKGTTPISIYIEDVWSKEDENDVQGAYTDEVAQALPHGEGEPYTDIAEAEADGWSWSEYKEESSDPHIVGTPIGTAILNHKLVLFTTTDSESSDYIYTFEYSSDKSYLIKRVVYNDNLNFRSDAPLETLISYESESIQKVYWVDGRNQPRVINIAAEDISSKPNTYFDFVPTLQLNEEISVKKILGGNGTFAPGVIQYAFTYYNKYGQESNIFYTTPLYYISYVDRGASPEDKVDNAFKITVENLDTNFDYLRIYSIQRTSINGTPICKRIQDIEIHSLRDAHGDPTTTASYTDTGTSGNTVDPTELLYKGGEVVIPSTIEQKDNTMFLGNFRTDRNSLVDYKDAIQAAVGVVSSEEGTPCRRTIYATKVFNGDYYYASQLSSYNDSVCTKSLPCGGFKRGDYYRCGVQFQHKSGKWSDPIWKGDIKVVGSPYASDNQISLPVLKGTIGNTNGILDTLISAGYIKIRPVVVFPELKDRVTLCQGVVNPTLYTENHRSDGNDDLYSQSSWFFRPCKISNFVNNNETVYPVSSGTLPYTSNITDGNDIYTADNIRQVEIQGTFNPGNKFKVDASDIATFHSPDIEFEEQFKSVDFNGLYYRKAGEVSFSKTFSAIDIQTESPAIKSTEGFVKKSFVRSSGYGIISGLYYDDFVVDDKDADDTKFEPYYLEGSSAKWMVYLWNKSGSLNNDINRPAGKGTPSAILKKKVVSNLRYADTSFSNSYSVWNAFTANPQLFASEEPTILKVGGELYQGNIDTIVLPDDYDGMYFAYLTDSTDTDNFEEVGGNTPFTSTAWWKTFSTNPDGANNWDGLRKYCYNDGQYKWLIFPHSFESRNKYNVGKYYKDLILKKEGVRIKYKSTPHLVFKTFGSYSSTEDNLPIIEVTRVGSDIKPGGIFGGETSDAFKENRWIPCGEPVSLLNSLGQAESTVSFEYSYGDTYFQRWDCLKTYSFTKEDINQVVEIGSFMLETHVNIDGRYDRNRGQVNNTNMSPQNFNLLNPVYSQIDNFFQYRIQDEDFYANTQYYNQITWSKTKESGADVDMWTNMTLASVLELDGDKGKINKLIRLNGQLLCFQDTGISQILYNENVQIESTQGVPIEIANSGKVQGKRYLSNTIGCSNKWSMVTTPSGIYFMDSNDKSIYLFNGQLQNVSLQMGFNTWCKQNIPSADIPWVPLIEEGDNLNYAGFYDKLNQDVIWVPNKKNNENSIEGKALAYSEKVGAFTSFYDYCGAPYFCNLDDTGIWVANEINSPFKLWRHQGGEYCNFFSAHKPYWMTLVGNPEPQMDKIFTNLEFRANTDIINPGDINSVPFDYLEAWNEYQHGMAHIDIRSGRDAFKHPTAPDGNATLKRKFRIWRCDIPRDNVPVPPVPVRTDYDTEEAYEAAVEARQAFFNNEAKLNIYRQASHPIDRMRNPWLYIHLYKSAGSYLASLRRTEIHDLVMTYFG